MEQQEITQIQIESITDPIMRYIMTMQKFGKLHEQLISYLEIRYMFLTKPEEKYNDRDSLSTEICNLKEVLTGLGDSVVYNSIMNEERLRYLASMMDKYVDMEALEKLRYDCDPGICVCKLSSDESSNALTDIRLYERLSCFQFDNVKLLLDCAHIIREVCTGIYKRYSPLNQSSLELFDSSRRKAIMEIAAADNKNKLITLDCEKGKYVWHGRNTRALTFLMGNLFCGDRLLQNGTITFGDSFPLGRNNELRKYWDMDYDFAANRRQMKIYGISRDKEFDIVNSWILKHDKTN
ncbi:MAG: hypothetical protein HUJ98_03125 [Bacteroidaceae bacterium]|nr:hypothetical protein [Bacteroidaceae bacterium]